MRPHPHQDVYKKKKELGKSTLFLLVCEVREKKRAMRGVAFKGVRDGSCVTLSTVWDRNQGF